MTRDEVLDKIRKLYALAGSTNPNEASAALAAADALVQKYRVEQAELGERPKFSLGSDIVESRRAHLWRLIILGSLCSRYACHGIRYHDGIRLWGAEDDVAIVRVLYDRICIQVDALASRNAAGKGRLFAASYRTGIADTVSNMLEVPAVGPRMGLGATSTALARLETKGERSYAALRETMAIEKFRPPESHIDPGALEAGRKDGKHVHLGEELSGAPKGALPAGAAALPGWEE